MKLFRKEEKTYPFSWEGLAQLEADSKYEKQYLKRTKDFMIEHPEVELLAILGVIGLATLILNPASSVIAFKCSGVETIKVAYKVLSVL